MLRSAIIFLTLSCILLGCQTGDNGNIIQEIKLGMHQNNYLRVQVDLLLNKEAEAYVEYWPDSTGNEEAKKTSRISPASNKHQIVLFDIAPNKMYNYNIVTLANARKTVSKTYTFKSEPFPTWLEGQFKYSASEEHLPGNFKKGFLLLNKRETPGIAYIVDYQGNLRWYQMVDGAGFKVTHFTKDTTIISILGKTGEQTSYGSQILEVNLNGDTLLHLKKGQGDFNALVHHEVLKKSNNEIVTLFVDEKIMNLSAAGGGKADTVNGDGIMIMDRNGKQLWKWSVFDVLNPLDDANLLKDKKDWMHANSLNYDKDSNYIVSFYNNGQIWKVDAKTGKVIWRLGKKGDVALPPSCDFTQAHAAHVNPLGELMFFDNGIDKMQSKVYALNIDEKKAKAEMAFRVDLPKEIYNDRMGSAYMVNDTTVLCCSSKRHIAVLANKKGILLWTLDTAVPPYRVEFIPGEILKDYLVN